MRARREEEYLNGNLTAMIDVVFQLIIFFVCTTNLQKESLDENIQLALAPHGKPVTTKNPLEINVDVDSKGRIIIARNLIEPDWLRLILKKAVVEYGADNVPVVVRADGGTRHMQIQTVLDACSSAGIYKIKFAAVKEKYVPAAK
jgi:biopolymer transport protein ExbD